MRWLQSEYLLKGIFLGLLVNVALRQAEIKEFDAEKPMQLAGCIVAGVAGALVLAALLKLREGYRIRGRLAPFLLFLLLESPTLVYAGVIAGTVGGAFWLHSSNDPRLAEFAAGGAGLGVLFGMLRDVKERRTRLALSLAMGAGLVALAANVFSVSGSSGIELNIENRFTLGVFLLLGVPAFYLLMFVGHDEETEVEVGALCATLGIGLLFISEKVQLGTAAFILPIIVYVWYTFFVLRKLRVFKYVLRGMSHAGVGRFKPALIAYRRALQLNPRHELAREQYWNVHLALDHDMLARDPELLQLVDFKLCVERAGSQLIAPHPDAQRLAEAHRLLDLVSAQRPALQPFVDYWRSVAFVHEGRRDEACDLLNHLLDPDRYKPGDKQRRAILLQAWLLALMLHDELRQRVGLPQLAQPGRRMEAIAAVERHWAIEADDPTIGALKRLLYQDLSETEFREACIEGRPPEEFDYRYVKEQGVRLIADPSQWERGAVLLGLAARGLASEAPSMFVRIAQAYEKVNRREDMYTAFARARKVGVVIGHKNLAEEERQAFFRSVKVLGEEAMNRDDLDQALDYFYEYSDFERSGVETLRTIAEIYERKGDILAALRVADRGLVYDSKDKDFLERKGRYYHSVTPEVLRANLEIAGPEFDVDYCIKSAKGVLDHPQSDLDAIDWAEHLVDLALVVKPEHRTLRVLKGRVHWRRGEIEQGAAVLEAVRTPKPEKFASGDDEEAWFQATQLLGEIYLNNLGRPQDAVACFNDYRKYPKSGAKTWLRLGQAYEQSGDRDRAVKCYKQAAAYEGNPLQHEAEEALDRLGSAR